MPNSSHGRRIRNSGRTVLGRFFMSLRTADRRVSPHPSSHRGTPGLCIASCLSRGFGSFESVIASPTAAGVLTAHGSRCAHAALAPPGRGLLVPSHDGATRRTRHTPLVAFNSVVFVLALVCAWQNVRHQRSC